MGFHVDALKDWVQALVGFVREAVDQIGLLRPFQNEVRVLTEKGCECNFHFPNNLDFRGQFFSHKILNFLAGVQRPPMKEILVARENRFECIAWRYFHFNDLNITALLNYR